jgi:hypothetical protein
MSDATAPDGSDPVAATPQTVRAAADAVKDALDRHLAAVEARTGEQDPAVQQAFDALQAAAERYDDLLFDVHEEVTPFEFGEAATQPTAELTGEAPVVSLFLRRDYAITEPESLLAAGQAAHRALQSANGSPRDEGEPEQLGPALFELFHAEGVDGLDEAAEEAGLEPLGGTVWFVVGDEPFTVAGEDSTPFDDADPDRLIYRVDEIVGDDT